MADPEIQHVILVPHEGQRGKLLAPGPCGSRPPFAILSVVREDRHEPESEEEGDRPGVCLSCGMRWPCPSAGEVKAAAYARWEAGRYHYANSDSGAWPGVALVLAWDGKAVGAGTDLLWRLLAPGAETHWPHGLVGEVVAAALTREAMGVSAALALADRTSALGALKLLGADGQEVIHG